MPRQGDHINSAPSTEAFYLIPWSQFSYFQTIPTTPKIYEVALDFMSQTSHFLLGTSSVVMATTLMSKYKPDACAKGE